MRRSTLKSMLRGAVLLSLFSTLPSFAQDSLVSIDPSYIVFADRDTGTQSTAATVTVSNEGYGSGLDIGAVSLGGAHSEDFNLSVDNCSNQSIVQDSSCSMQIKFAPLNSGLKSTMLTIPYGSGDAALSVYLSNEEDRRHEVQRRLPPLVSALDIPEEMNATATYNLTWTATGYHGDYRAFMLMYDCTGIAVGECGARYDSPGKFYQTALLSSAQSTQGSWTYSTESTQNFQYTQTYTIPATRPSDSSAWPAIGTPIVIRIFILSADDVEAEKLGLSLIIPGNLSDNYYDTSGRKIQKIICPSDGCTP